RWPYGQRHFFMLLISFIHASFCPLSQSDVPARDQYHDRHKSDRRPIGSGRTDQQRHDCREIYQM
ncbi:MAG: hypothetical protein ACI39G_00215, partial [Pseudoramibacter sp.]